MLKFCSRIKIVLLYKFTLTGTNLLQQVTTYSRQFRKTILLGCIKMKAKYIVFLLDNDCSIRAYQL